MIVPDPVGAAAEVVVVVVLPDAAEINGGRNVKFKTMSKGECETYVRPHNIAPRRGYSSLDSTVELVSNKLQRSRERRHTLGVDLRVPSQELGERDVELCVDHAARISGPTVRNRVSDL